MKIFITVTIVLIALNLAAASTAVPLPRLLRPEAIILDNKQMFVVEGIHIYIYSLTDFKLKKKIGKQGEGPKEFKKESSPIVSSVKVYIQPDYIFVSGGGKVGFYTREGEFIRETRTASPINRYIPLGKKYVGVGVAREDKGTYITLNIYENFLKKGKEMIRFPFPARPGKKLDLLKVALMDDAFTFYKNNEMLLVPSREHGIIYVFDREGKESHRIAYDFPKVTVTAELKNQLDGFFEEDPRFKALYQMAKASNRLEYPQYLPFIKDCRVSDQKVYVITYKQNGKKFESFVFEINGKMLKKVFLPLAASNILELYPFTIYKGKIYQLVENEDRQEWQLHITEIE